LAERRLKLNWLGRFRFRRALQLFGTLSILVLLWYGAPQLLRRLEFFRIRRVEIAGLQYLAPSKIIAALELNARSSVFDDLLSAGREVRALPGVESALVRRRLPGTLEIVVEEALPVALAPRGGGLALLDSTGKILPFDPVATAPDLPIAASADRLVARVLAHVRESDPVLFGRVGTAWRVRDDVVLDLEGRRLWFGSAVTAEDIRAVMAVAQELGRQGRKYQELDGRFAGQVIVRGTGA
jgi:cell division septal protein FtsQ